MQTTKEKLVGNYCYLSRNQDDAPMAISELCLVKFTRVLNMDHLAGYLVTFDLIAGNPELVFDTVQYTEEGCQAIMGLAMASRLQPQNSKYIDYLKLGEAISKAGLQFKGTK